MFAMKLLRYLHNVALAGLISILIGCVYTQQLPYPSDWPRPQYAKDCSLFSGSYENRPQQTMPHGFDSSDDPLTLRGLFTNSDFPRNMREPTAIRLIVSPDGHVQLNSIDVDLPKALVTAMNFRCTDEGILEAMVKEDSSSEYSIASVRFDLRFYIAEDGTIVVNIRLTNRGVSTFLIPIPFRDKASIWARFHPSGIM